MTLPLRPMVSTACLFARAALVGLAIAAPLVAASAVRADYRGTIEAPPQQKMGAGFVLMISLQRA